MRASTRTILIALGGSLAAHAAGLLIGWEYYALFVRPRLAAAMARPPELIVSLAPDDTFEEDMGLATGTGIGSNASPGERPMQAREADEDQALLSRDPIGMGRIGGPPTPYTGTTGQDGADGQPAMSVPPVRRPAQSSEPSADPIATPPAPAAAASTLADVSRRADADVRATDVPDLAPRLPDANAHPSAARPVSKTSAVAKAVAAPQPVAVATAATPQPQPGDRRKPGPRVDSADPLPPSPSESDPFARISGTVVFHNGKLEARHGREVHTTRPHLLYAAMVDLFTLRDPLVVLEVHIAPSGNVTDVKVAHSSGSIDIDEPTRLAVYDWWFAPAHDARGRPVADVTMFSVEYR